MLVNALLAYLFDGQPHPLQSTMESWLLSSRRFTDFVTTFRDKIRKKLRVLQEKPGTPQDSLQVRESLRDLRLELETAYLLLQERLLSLSYEPHQSGQTRCPDFAVTFTTRVTFMVEVTRMRAVPSSDHAETYLSDLLADAVCGKLGQLLPHCANVLVLGLETTCPAPPVFQAALIRLQQRVEQNDLGLLRWHHFQDRADFFRRFQRLSEVLVRGFQEDGGDGLSAATAWVNPQAKHPLPDKTRTALHRSHAASFLLAN